MEIGIHHNQPFDEYLSLRGGVINSGALKAGFETFPSLLQMHTVVTGENDSDDSNDRRLGRNLHCYLLEGKKEFYKRCVIAGQCAALKKGDGMPCENAGILYDGKQWYCKTRGHAPPDAEQPEEYATEEDLIKIEKTAETLRSHPSMTSLKRPGWSEVTIIWEMFGLKFKGRIDRASLDGKQPILVDLKKHDQSPLTYHSVNRVVDKYLYWIQSSLYLMGIEELTGIKARWLWMFVRTKPSPDVQPLWMPMSMYEAGKRHIRDICEEYKRQLDAGEFPGVSPDDRGEIAMMSDWNLNRNLREELERERASDEDAVNSVAGSYS